MSDESPIIHVIPQRHDGDCAVACFAMLAGVSYEEALIALGEQEPRVLKMGVWKAQMKRAATALGYRLRLKRQYDLEADSGLLSFSDHVVVLRVGLVITTQGTLWDAEDFCSYYMRKYHESRPQLYVFERLQQEGK